MVRHDDEQTPWVADQTVGNALRITASRHPDGDALVFPALGLRWSWGEFDRRVDLAASGLIARGVERGEHVGIWSMNVPEWVVTTTHPSAVLRSREQDSDYELLVADLRVVADALATG